MLQLKAGFILALSLTYYVSVALCSDDQDDGGLKTVTRLRQDLFKNYSRNVRPVPKNGNATVVYLQLEPMFLVQLDEVKQLLVMDAWLLMHWLDERLAWNMSSYGGLSHIPLGDKEVWQPDIEIFKSITAKIDKFANTHLYLIYTGDIIWVPPVSLKSFCPFNIAGYPNDEQTCGIQMNSWTHHGLQIDLEVLEEGMNLYFFENENTQWNLTSTSSRKTVLNYTRPFVYVEFFMTFRRRPVAALKVVHGPSLAILFMSLAMFWFPPKLDKIFIGTVAILCLIFLVIYVARNTLHPAAIPLAVSPQLSIIYIVTSALILEIIVGHVQAITGLRRPPDRIRRVLSNSIFRVLTMGVPRPRVVILSTQLSTTEVKDAVEKKVTPDQEWTLVTVAMDRILFIIYTAVFIAVYMTQ